MDEPTTEPMSELDAAIADRDMAEAQRDEARARSSYFAWAEAVTALEEADAEVVALREALRLTNLMMDQFEQWCADTGDTVTRDEFHAARALLVQETSPDA